MNNDECSPESDRCFSTLAIKPTSNWKDALEEGLECDLAVHRQPLYDLRFQTSKIVAMSFSSAASSCLPRAFSLTRKK